MIRVFEQRELDYIKSNYKKLTYKEITNEINKFNEVKKDEKQVRTKASTMGLSKRKHLYDRNYFSSINEENKAYWLGFIYADGWVCVSKDGSELGIELQESDKKHLEKFVRDINGNMQVDRKLQKDRVIKGIKVEGGTYSAIIRLFSRDIVRDLISHGVVERKTTEKEFPIVSNKELFRHFLRGFMDGDGCISATERSKNVHMTNPNVDFLLYIKSRLKEENNIECKLFTEYELKSRLYFNHEDAIKLLSYLYTNENISMDRKRLLLKNI